jgi:hypothetical protein
MLRIVITFDPEDRAWLDRKARQTGRPVTALVREAVAHYRAEDGRHGNTDLAELVRKTKGLRKRGDGLVWQDKLRDEWER